MRRESTVRANHPQPASAVPPFFCACLTQLAVAWATTSIPPLDLRGGQGFSVFEWTILVGVMMGLHVPGLTLGLALSPRVIQADRSRYVAWGAAVGALSPGGVTFLVSAFDSKNPGAVALFTNAVNMVACIVVLRFAIGQGWLHRAARPGHCAQCGYDLRASGETCPECGARKETPEASAAKRPASW